MSRLTCLFPFLLLLAPSCLPDPLPVDGVELSESTVVIGAQNVPGEFLALSLTKSFNALEGGTEDDLETLLQDLLISNVLPTVNVQNSTYALASVQPGLYVGTDIPEIVNEVYTLNFNNPYNRRPVTASTQLLPFIGFETIQLRLEETAFDTLINVDMRIDDPPGANWYMVNVQTFNEDYDFDNTPFTELVDDSTFDGQVYDYSFRVFFRDYTQGDSILVSMANINKSYFDFLQLRNNQRFLLLDGLGEPVTYPTNVQNGLGYFHMHIPDVRLFVFE